MASIYVHIPFCKSRCRYCDFYSTTLLSRREAYVLALQNEIRTLKSPILPISTVYFGGGTPSLLEVEDIRKVLDTIREKEAESGHESHWTEVTMEANPGDLTLDKLQALREAGVNRLSIGIQTFHTPLLRRIGRRHSREEAIAAVEMAQQARFDNISIDLMYGLPGQTMEDWEADLEQVATMHVQHVSAYCLTYEADTPLYRDLEAGIVAEADDELANAMQEKAVERLAGMGINRYEISNYAREGYESKHNSAYWTHAPYYGIGAGAHSFDGTSRRYWNRNDIEGYISLLNNGAIHSAQSLQEWQESEELSQDDLYNETVMLGLRTVKGVEIKGINKNYLEHCFKQAQPYIDAGILSYSAGYLAARGDGFHILNRIIEDLMI